MQDAAITPQKTHLSERTSPSDIEALLNALDTKDRELEQKNQIIDKKSDVIEAQQQRIAILEEYLRLQRARHFGPKSEKNPNQTALLFNEAEALDALSSVETALESLQETTETPKKRGRKSHLLHLEPMAEVDSLL